MIQVRNSTSYLSILKVAIRSSRFIFFFPELKETILSIYHSLFVKYQMFDISERDKRYASRYECEELTMLELQFLKLLIMDFNEYGTSFSVINEIHNEICKRSDQFVKMIGIKARDHSSNYKYCLMDFVCQLFKWKRSVYYCFNIDQKQIDSIIEVFLKKGFLEITMKSAVVKGQNTKLYNIWH
jgi:hypothetical protein